MFAIERFDFAPFNRVFDALVPPAATAWKYLGYSPSADIRETAEGYTIELDLPGLTEKDVRVTLEARELTVQGERKAQETDGYTRRERGFGTFERVFHLPEDVDVGHIEAKSKNGVLTLRLPRAESAKPKTINIVAS